MKPNLRTLLLATAACVLAGSVCAQQTPDGSKPAADGSKADLKPRISLIAVGDPPSPDYDIKGGKRELKGTAEEDFPPTLLWIKEKKDYKQITLGLNSPADSIRHPGGAELSIYAGKEEGKEPFIKVGIPPIAEDLSVFLIRNPATKSWRVSPISRVFKNGLESFPLNSLRVMNFSRVPLKVEILGKVFDLAAQGTSVVPLTKSEQGILSYRIAAQVDGGMFMLADTATTYPTDARVNIVAYEADGKDKRQPVKLMTYFELPYKDPAKEKKDPAKDPAATGTAAVNPQ